MQNKNEASPEEWETPFLRDEMFTMKKSCLIISGGDKSEFPAQLSADLVIACDRGYRYAEEFGIEPDLIIGDFDSAARPASDRIPVIVYPSEKDDTDTMLAVRYALEHDCRRITILCAMGGRLDHSIANLQTGAFVASHQGTAQLYGENEIITIFADSACCFPRKPGWSLSVFSMSDRCSGVSISGTAYEVENAELVSSFPLGASNNWEAESARIQVANGTLMVVESRLRPGEHI